MTKLDPPCAFTLKPLEPINTRLFLLWLMGRLKRRRVFGESMQPTLRHGSEVLINTRKGLLKMLDKGDIVLIEHPYQPKHVIKRIDHYNQDRSAVFVTGDNANESTDSRSYGLIPAKRIIGKVICQFS